MNMMARITPEAIGLKSRLIDGGDLDQARLEKGWTATRTRVAIALFNSGLSAREVAAEIGGVSRNAVIGKVHRSEAVDPQRKLPLGSTEQCTGIRQQRKPRKRRRVHERGPMVRVKAMPKEPKEAPPPIVDAQIPMAQRRTLEQLDNGCCHWPVGDPRSADFFFCGAPKPDDPDQPYCAAHRFRSLQPASVGPRRNIAAFASAAPGALWRSVR
ncbi:GcrA family cell cycle regulator [Bradyrhizobium sp. BR 10289]|uniref:GcrA family cell cycle regulator n=1 Tax=Bradyrhizobium sp. BR 10289 TaxID=2749993 RepID=UPI001C651D43|nr:GcrA family cell cycle regulator [Bradyrhizobium sp. BR 10289]MBW7968154.1 GcrA cell cycle regulator [Bradyrhizobium sp. BR 10289]